MENYPAIVLGRVSYELQWNSARICGEAYIPQELVGKFMELMDELELFNESAPT
ncbi:MULTISPECIES: hypothetical protein [unclassified Flavonifractor]|uniref:hypothetical protein n=1 Tax=unclassified Flavonifractor TaxID=2629267 RepID=UPI001302E238|nr:MULTISPECIES: hypothetical protein [unclassified Flavonifractor]